MEKTSTKHQAGARNRHGVLYSEIAKVVKANEELKAKDTPKVTFTPEEGKLDGDEQPMPTPPNKPEEKEVETPSPLTVEVQLQKMDRLYDMSQRRTKLLETRDNLTKFKTASDEHTNKLEITDGRGSKFNTHNPQIIGEIIELLKKDIASKLLIVDESIVTIG